jgi:hypothetical protein
VTEVVNLVTVEWLSRSFRTCCFKVIGKKCNPNRKFTEMSRTGNLLLLISSLILRCFHLLCIFIYLKHIDYNKMLKYIQKVERCSFLISRSVKCVTRTTKVDNSVFPKPEIFSFITRFLLENRVFLHLKLKNHNNFY